MIVEKKTIKATILNKRKNIFLGLVCVVVFVIILVAGLWPFSFWPRNEVRWLSDSDGLAFDGGGIVYSSGPVDMPGLFGNESITVELWVEPDTDANWHTDHWHYAQILSLYDVERKSEVFTVGQWRQTLQIRNRLKGPRSYKKIGLGKVLKMGMAPFVTLTSDGSGTVIFVDGRLERAYPDFSVLTGDAWGNVKLLLGNSPSGKTPWNGRLLGLSVYNRRLTVQEVALNYRAWLDGAPPAGEPVIRYSFDERTGEMVHDRAGEGYDLLIPDILRVFERPKLFTFELGQGINKSFVKDVMINVLGFMPLGFFLMAVLSVSTGFSRRGRLLLTVLVGAAMSLGIESTQVYLVARSPSLVDLGCNVLGTFGGILALLVLGRGNTLKRLH